MSLLFCKKTIFDYDELNVHIFLKNFRIANAILLATKQKQNFHQKNNNKEAQLKQKQDKNSEHKNCLRL